MLRALFLFPVSLIYGFAVKFRNLLFDYKILKSKEFDIPVICVGNITVGGTGKTPHIEYLIEILKDKFKTAVLSRGYKRKTAGFILADNESKAEQIGDEPAQIKQKFGTVEVAVDENRVRGVETLLEKIEKLEVVLLDDAFQHRYIKPSLSIVLIDYNRMVFEDLFLPYGRLRDSIKQLHRAGILIITKTPDNIKPIEMRIISKNLNLLSYQTLYFTGLKYGALQPVFGECDLLLDKNISQAQQYSCLAVSGIADPKLFLNHVSEFTKEVSKLIFPDHHAYTPADDKKILETFQKIAHDKKFIVTTEKDAVRLKNCDFLNPEIKKRLFYISIKPFVLNNGKEDFEKQIIGFVERDFSRLRMQVSQKKFKPVN
jgi:tetraacyldisaccharide 4'-kinase